MTRYLIPIFTVFLLVSEGQAEEATLTLDSALSEGLKKHPDIITADADLKVRLAETVSIAEIPNPRLEAEFRALNDEPIIELKLMQPIRRSYFGLRKNYALVEQASAKADARARIAGVLNDVFNHYVEVWSVQEMQAIRQRNREDFSALREALDRSVKAGLGGAVDLAMLDAEAASESAEADALEQRRLSSCAALSRRIGRSDGKVFRVERPAGFALPADSGNLERFAVRRTPLRVALLKREEAARARLSFARSERFSPMEAGLLAEHDSDEGGILLGIGFNMDLPVWNRNEAAIAKAEAEIGAIRSEMRLTEPAKVSAMVKLRHRAALAAGRSAADYQNDVVTRFETALSQARETIAKGQGAAVQILPVVTRLSQSRMRAFELQVAAIEARSELEAALGGRVEEAMASAHR